MRFYNSGGYMQEITTTNSSNIKKVNPILDFDLDDFDFKPVTKGLGFHHGKEKIQSVGTTVRTTRPIQSRKGIWKP